MSPYQQVLELLATARAIAETHGLTDVEAGLCDTISDVRWHAEQDGVDVASPALARDLRRTLASRLMLRYGAREVAA